MATFLMFGKYTTKALKEISSKRTDKAIGLIKELGGEVNSMYATLGEHDLLLIVDFPDTERAMKASVVLNKLTHISFTTSAAVSVEEFDKMMAEL